MQSKTPITSAHNILTNFLSENTKYQINDIKQSMGNLDEIDDDDEIWILQCPKSIEPQQLKEHKIKLPGKSNCDIIETFAEEFSKNTEICFGFKADDKFQIKQFPIKGSILVREKLKVVKTEKSNEDINNISSIRVPFPANLKIRHPIHGHQFEERIQLNEDIRERLRESDEIIKKKKLKKSITTMKEEYYESSLSDINKKRKHKSDKSKVCKELKVENDDEDISTDLAWIKNI